MWLRGESYGTEVWEVSAESERDWNTLPLLLPVLPTLLPLRFKLDWLALTVPLLWQESFISIMLVLFLALLPDAGESKEVSYHSLPRSFFILAASASDINGSSAIDAMDDIDVFMEEL